MFLFNIIRMSYLVGSDGNTGGENMEERRERRRIRTCEDLPNKYVTYKEMCIPHSSLSVNNYPNYIDSRSFTFTHISSDYKFGMCR